MKPYITTEQRKEIAWTQCLALWKELSEMSDIYTIRQNVNFKNNVLMRLGYKKMALGCPFCDLYRDSCKGCPIEPCLSDFFGSSPYGEYLTVFTDRGNDIHFHSQKHAFKFYEHLLHIYKQKH